MESYVIVRLHKPQIHHTSASSGAGTAGAEGGFGRWTSEEQVTEQVDDIRDVDPAVSIGVPHGNASRRRFIQEKPACTCRRYDTSLPTSS